MGMAASQARYLALTARKTNTEWEGQQINQARTALANQSANLFNQLLGLEVPNPPKTTDYTEVQYSYSDGQNESVIDDWKQLSTPNPDYNYIVNHYYFADVYTGARKLLQDPQIQTKGEVVALDYTEQLQSITYNANNKTYTIELNDGTKNIYKAITTGQVKGDLKLENALRDFETAKGLAQDDGVLPVDGVYGYQDSLGTWHFFYEEEIETPTDYSTQYYPTYVGNCKLTELKAENPDDAALTQEQAAALSQILRDCPEDSNIREYLSFDEDGSMVYSGAGVYTFTMQNQIYYTTEKDLLNSLQTNYFYEKPIDDQRKLAYYSAGYVRTKIEEKNNALLETDSEGRFKSVKFDNDSIVYSLNCETVTDEAAYQDALNQYLYKKEKYEKTIADINAKTEKIQQQDRTLELRLKQLDTEQNALATEMEAVKKVIKDNVEKTFKTFGD